MVIKSRVAATLLIVGALLAGAAVPSWVSAAQTRECGRLTGLPKGYTARVNVEGASCRSARIVVRDNLVKRIRFQTGGTGITHKRGWRCQPAHGDETMCTRGRAVAFGYDLRR